MLITHYQYVTLGIGKKLKFHLFFQNRCNLRLAPTNQLIRYVNSELIVMLMQLYCITLKSDVTNLMRKNGSTPVKILPV